MKNWSNDPAHSRLGFVVKHLTISEINGRFADFSATVTASKPDFSDGQFAMSAKTASIDTEVQARDKHLLSADFFDAEKYPDVTFKSTGVSGLESGKGTITGELSMHGVTKPVTFDIIHLGTVTNPMNKNETAGFKISGVVKKSDFKIGPNFPELVVGDAVHVTANVEFSPK